MGSDPVTSGLVASLSRPGGNITGATFFTTPLVTKRLELLRELVPAVVTIAVLVNPNNLASTSEGADAQAMAQPLGHHTVLFNARQFGDSFAPDRRDDTE
jgi:putative ABC transport system substrate-binding protein